MAPMKLLSHDEICGEIWTELEHENCVSVPTDLPFLDHDALYVSLLANCFWFQLIHSGKLFLSVRNARIHPEAVMMGSHSIFDHLWRNP